MIFNLINWRIDGSSAEELLELLCRLNILQQCIKTTDDINQLLTKFDFNSGLKNKIIDISYLFQRGATTIMLKLLCDLYHSTSNKQKCCIMTSSQKAIDLLKYNINNLSL